MKKFLVAQAVVLVMATSVMNRVEASIIRDPNGYIDSDYVRISGWPDDWYIYEKMSIDIAFTDHVVDLEYIKVDVHFPQNSGEMKEIIVTDGWHVAHCRFDVSEDGHDYTIMIPTRQIKDFDRYFGLSFLFIK